MAAPPPPTSQSQSNATRTGASLFYDFTKRKRWADLLMVELAETLAFVITPTTRVIYCQCGGMADEVLGWSESDFIDCELTDFVNPEDQEHFLLDIQDCLRLNQEGTTYARIRPNHVPSIRLPSEEATYEFKKYPHTHPDDPDTKVLVVTARQYFYRSGNSLAHAIADLKQENMLLQERVDALRSLVSTDATSGLTASYAHNDVPISIYSSSSLPSRSLGTESPGVKPSDYPGEVAVPPPPRPNTIQIEEEPQESEGSKKKKFKKSHGTEQYVCVTCGRTDSPEWRKGPLGPKTLCNACGLRWAKQVRKTDDAAATDGKDAGSHSSQTPPERSNSPS